jgi:hypothetical protein
MLLTAAAEGATPPQAIQKWTAKNCSNLDELFPVCKRNIRSKPKDVQSRMIHRSDQKPN